MHGLKSLGRVGAMTAQRTSTLSFWRRLRWMLFLPLITLALFSAVSVADACEYVGSVEASRCVSYDVYICPALVYMFGQWQIVPIQVEVERFYCAVA